MFFEDACTAAPILGVALTQRSGTPMCGVPYHAIDAYLAKLIRVGKSVAICDQMEDPSKAKGLVRREVTRVVTPEPSPRMKYSTRRATITLPRSMSAKSWDWPERSLAGAFTVEAVPDDDALADLAQALRAQRVPDRTRGARRPAYTACPCCRRTQHCHRYRRLDVRV